MDIATWLRELGLERYEEAFRENDVDAEVLPKLTAEDLLAIGVTSVGHRRRLLEAIAALAAAAEPPAAVPNAQAEGDKPRKSEAERRQLTVMYVDLVGSTEFSARLDPEDVGQVIRSYQVACAEVVERWDGHVAKYMGDGVLAYFGWPQAHEDDAERAVRAGLEVTAAVGKLATPVGSALAARVGIATGLAMVGELFGEGAAREETVVGDVPNQAARLQALAEPGTVVIGRVTRRLLGGTFEVADLGPQRLKGFAEPHAVYRVQGEGHAAGRFEARQIGGLTPLIGRAEEISLLLRRWRQASEGEGQVVLLSGEPGIGKSRLVREMRERLGHEPHIRLLYQCSPHHTTSALHPMIEQLERAAGFERDDPPEIRLDRLEALLVRGTDRLDQAAPLIAALLGLATAGRYPALNLTPQGQKQRTLEILVNQLEGLAATQPVLLAYEDVHWIDPTTQELLGLAIERVQRLPVLAIITFRPEFNPPWSGQPHVSALALTRLGRRDGAAMVAQIVQDKALPAEVSAEIIAKTDGVPLFVEELTKAVLESGVLEDAGDRYELTGPLPPLAIPATLHDSLLARLDRLAPSKEVAQIGAAIGREFSYPLLAAVADQPEDQLQSALDQLVSSELVFRRGIPPEATYSFKHALVQDAAYGTLLKSKRQHLHARIAQVLEEQFPEMVETEPELLARHCAQAALVEKAVHYWHKAGWQAIARSAMGEAVVQLKLALSLLAKLPAGSDRDHKELDLQIALGGAFVSTTGFASPEAGSAYLRARELSRQADATPQVLAVFSGLIQFHTNRAELDAAYKAAREQLRLAEQWQDTAALVSSQRMIGQILAFSGKFVPALKYLDQALALYDPIYRNSTVFLPFADSRVTCLNFIAWVLLFLGYPDQALVQSHDSLAGAHGLRPYDLTFALHVSCLFNQIRGDLRVVQEQSSRLTTLATEHCLPHWVGTGTIFQGWALTAEGELEAGIAQMRQGLIAKLATGAQLKVPYYLGLLAAAYTQAGNAMESLDLLADALTRVDRTGECWFEAELHRLKGEALLSADRSTEAEGSFRKALSVALAQGARLWELRIATSLARMWRDQSQRTQAHDLLTPVYGWFTEGFDTGDLKEAKALLDELS